MKEFSFLICYGERKLKVHMPHMKVIAFISNKSVQLVKNVHIYVYICYGISDRKLEHISYCMSSETMG